MVQEEMSVDAIREPDPSTASPEFNPCRILSFCTDEPSKSVDDRFRLLISLLDK